MTSAHSSGVPHRQPNVLPPALRSTIDAIQPLDQAALAAARERQAQLTKPPGSLGRLEALSIQLAGITGQAQPLLPRKTVITLAADHGVTAEGVSLYPAEVTPQMVANFLRGGAAINVLARAAGARVLVADVGVAGALDDLAAPDGAAVQFVSARLALGTANIARGPAMSIDLALQAIETGVRLVESEYARGVDVVATGEMGIGNTTASSCIVAALTGAAVDVVTGRGTGLDDARLAHKRNVVTRALATNQPDPSQPLDVLAKVGGLEIAGLVGVILGAASHRLPVVVDGFISGAAALVAARLAPQVRPYLIAAHRSAEPGHAVVLDALDLRPLLDLDLRLGEGTGAALAFPLLDAACLILREMATFASAGVAGPEAG